MSSLTGQQIKDTYQSLLKTDDNGLITSAFKGVTDGSGSASGLYLKSDGILVSGSFSSAGDVNITGSLIVNGIEIVSGSTIEVPFSYNQTSGTNRIKEHENIFNHGDLLVQSNNIFIVEDNAEYYTLGDITNNGEIIVSGSLIVDGGLILNGPVFLKSGSGQIL